MAGRKTKVGIDFFPIEVSIYSDLKIRRLLRENGGDTLSVYLCLLTHIYREGFYLKWSNDLPFIISEDTKLEEDYVQKVIESCLSLNLFNEGLYQQKKILTSKGIQERYSFIAKKLNRANSEIRNYSLINSEEIPINSEEIPINSEEMPINSGEMQQTKLKEKKLNETKSNEIEINPISIISEKLIFNRIDSEKLQSELENSESWLVDICTKISLETKLCPGVPDLKGFIPEFMLNLAAQSKFPISLKEARSYFSNWIVKKTKINNSESNKSYGRKSNSRVSDEYREKLARDLQTGINQANANELQKQAETIDENLDFNLEDSSLLEKELMNSIQWISDLKAYIFSKHQLQINEAQVNKYIILFILEARAGSKFPISLRESKEYFKNWLPKKYVSDSERKSTGLGPRAYVGG